MEDNCPWSGMSPDDCNTQEFKSREDFRNHIKWHIDKMVELGELRQDGDIIMLPGVQN